jgi:hypothetical protein
MACHVLSRAGGRAAWSWTAGALTAVWCAVPAGLRGKPRPEHPGEDLVQPARRRGHGRGLQGGERGDIRIVAGQVPDGQYQVAHQGMRYGGQLSVAVRHGPLAGARPSGQHRGAVGGQAGAMPDGVAGGGAGLTTWCTITIGDLGSTGPCWSRSRCLTAGLRELTPMLIAHQLVSKRGHGLTSVCEQSVFGDQGGPDRRRPGPATLDLPTQSWPGKPGAASVRCGPAECGGSSRGPGRRRRGPGRRPDPAAPDRAVAPLMVAGQCRG